MSERMQGYARAAGLAAVAALVTALAWLATAALAMTVLMQAPGHGRALVHALALGGVRLAERGLALAPAALLAVGLGGALAAALLRPARVRGGRRG